MSANDSGLSLGAEITEMSQNMILKINSDNTIDAKISRPKKPGDTALGKIRINQQLYTTNSYEFIRIYPR